jgi:predicted ATP-binding protein involved in virulence
LVLRGQKFSYKKEEYEIKGLLESPELPLNWRIEIDRKKFNPGNLSDLSAIQKIGSYIDEIRRNIDIKTFVSIPVLVYYPCRVLIESSKELSSNGYDLFAAYGDALSGSSVNLTGFLKWYHREENIARQRKDERLPKTIQQAIYGILSGTGDQIFNNLHIDFLDYDYPDGKLVIEKDGIAVQVKQLSSGEKMLFLLVADLAKRMALANPESDNPLQEGSGVVLIDEIDLHLHPAWQRMVIPKLTSLFPNLQFIMTTHSPLVLQQVRSENIRILDDGKIYGAEDTLGQPVSSILNVVMGTPENLHKDVIKEIFKQIAIGDFKAAREQILQLEKQVQGKLPDLEQAKAVIHRKMMLTA